MWDWVRSDRLRKAEIQAEAERVVREAPRGLAYVYACNAYARTPAGTPEQAKAAAVRLRVRRLERPGAKTATRLTQDANPI